MSSTRRVVDGDRSTMVRFVTDRVASRLVEAIEQDETDHAEGHATTDVALNADPRRQ